MQITKTEHDYEAMLERAKQFARKYGPVGIVDADDIAQTAMIRFLNRRGKTPSIMGWLYKTVRSVAFDAGRRKKQEANYFATSSDSDFAGKICELADDAGYVPLHTTYIPARDERDPDLIPRLNTMLLQMPPQLRQALMLHARGFKYHEIAALTDVSVGTVRSRIHHARRKAQELLNEI